MKLKRLQRLSQSFLLQTSQAVGMHVPSLSDQNNKHPAEQLLHTNRTGPSHQHSIPSKDLRQCESPTPPPAITFEAATIVVKLLGVYKS